MKKLLTLSLLSILFFFGCDPDSDITSPLNSVDEGTSSEILPDIPDSIEVIPWPYPPGADTIFTSLGLPESEIPNLVVSKVIDGNVGDQIEFNYEYENIKGDTISIWAWLKIRTNAFDGVKEISIIFNHKIAAVSFYPHMVFRGQVDFEIEYNGLDLSKTDTNSIDFLYQNYDGTTEQIMYDSLQTNVSTGRIFLDDGKLEHFSRYGFVN